jgi:hypothetical protein
MKRWSRSDWLLVAAVGGMGVLLLRGVLRGHDVSVPRPFGMGFGELVLILLIVIAVFGSTRLR